MAGLPDEGGGARLEGAAVLSDLRALACAAERRARLRAARRPAGGRGGGALRGLAQVAPPGGGGPRAGRGRPGPPDRASSLALEAEASAEEDRVARSGGSRCGDRAGLGPPAPVRADRGTGVAPACARPRGRGRSGDRRHRPGQRRAAGAAAPSPARVRRRRRRSAPAPVDAEDAAVDRRAGARRDRAPRRGARERRRCRAGSPRRPRRPAVEPPAPCPVDLAAGRRTSTRTRTTASPPTPRPARSRARCCGRAGWPRPAGRPTRSRCSPQPWSSHAPSYCGCPSSTFRCRGVACCVPPRCSPRAHGSTRRAEHSPGPVGCLRRQRSPSPRWSRS